MVVNMNDQTVTETLDPVQTNATTITITLNPQPNRVSDNCDNSLTAITSSTGEATISNMSPSSCDSDSLQSSQMMVKKSLKLELTHNNNDIKSMDTPASPEIEDDALFKSPSSPRTCKLSYTLILEAWTWEHIKHACLTSFYANLQPEIVQSHTKAPSRPKLKSLMIEKLFAMLCIKEFFTVIAERFLLSVAFCEC